jgi:hypothetical protein
MNISNTGSTAAVQSEPVKRAPKDSSADEAREQARLAAKETPAPKAEAKQPGMGDQVDMSA